jgi:hypothetical protein
MRRFTDEDGRDWEATALEEDTPRHHGRWYLVLRAPDGSGPELTLPEVRWQNRQTAERTLRTMSEFELRRRLRIAARRHEAPGMARTPFGSWKAGAPGARDGTPPT